MVFRKTLSLVDFFMATEVPLRLGFDPATSVTTVPERYETNAGL